MRAYLKTLGGVHFVLLALLFIQGTLTQLRLFPAKVFQPSAPVQNRNNPPTLPSATSNSEHLISSREYVYEKRRNLINDGCKQVNDSNENGTKSANKELLVDKIHFIYYCPIAKVSSTFWKRLLTVLASEGKLNSPFDISLGGVRLSKLDQLSKQEIKVLRKKGTSFMFVRDPYARLFSGYENKIYHANLMFWNIIGRPVVSVVRDNHEDVYKNFGFDVTFSEFIKYVLYLSESGRQINGHFSPMNRKCNPCSTHFQYIGKLETFADDANFLISKWTNEFADVSLHFDDFEKESALDTARGHVNFLFQTKKILDEIKFPFIKIMIRTWRDLQIRGYLSKYIEFPYKESDAELVTKEEFFEAIKKVLSIPVNRTEVKRQRQEALIQAYRQIPIEDMERLRNYVLQDCLLFGYDDRPQILFDRAANIDSDFNYLEGLTND